MKNPLYFVKKVISMDMIRSYSKRLLTKTMNWNMRKMVKKKISS